MTPIIWGSLVDIFNQYMKVSSTAVTNVIIKHHGKEFLDNIRSLYMKVSGMDVTNVIIKQQCKEILNSTNSQYRTYT